MLTDLLSTVAEGGKVILEEENYLLARVSIEGKPVLVEISRGFSGGLLPEDWPDVDGVLLADSQIHPEDDSETSILLFTNTGNAELYLETIVRNGRFSENVALTICKDVLKIVRTIHDEGFRIGYLGPENVLRTGTGQHYILGGARGIPDTPFSPPEAIGKTADDPRSDVYALGLFMFRLIAGSDNRRIQVEAWNKLSKEMLELLENMVSPESDNRFPNLMVLSEKMGNFKPVFETTDDAGKPKCKRTQNSGRNSVLIYSIVTIAVIVTLLLLILQFGGRLHEQSYSIPDSVALVPGADSVEADAHASAEAAGTIVERGYAEPVIWISNGTGQPGRASEFRQGPASNYSSVYSCSGSHRGNSILLARRENPYLPLEDQERIYPIAELLASGDSSIRIVPVDITMLLGKDLSADQVSTGIVYPVSDPAGTLYVDIANHGLEGTYGNAGAATWVRSVLNNRSITLDGEEWLISVVDFRDGDSQNSDLGIPASLESTLFLYHTDIPLLAEAEEVIRTVFLRNTAGDSPIIALPVPPDIWVLLGM